MKKRVSWMQLSQTLVKCVLSHRVLLSNYKIIECCRLSGNSILCDLRTLLNLTKIKTFCYILLIYFIPFTVYDYTIKIESFTDEINHLSVGLKKYFQFSFIFYFFIL